MRYMRDGNRYYYLLRLRHGRYNTTESPVYIEGIKRREYFESLAFSQSFE
jgi:hypothetical protein